MSEIVWPDSWMKFNHILYLLILLAIPLLVSILTLHLVQLVLQFFMLSLSWLQFFNVSIKSFNQLFSFALILLKILTIFLFSIICFLTIIFLPKISFHFSINLVDFSLFTCDLTLTAWNSFIDKIITTCNFSSLLHLLHGIFWVS